MTSPQPQHSAQDGLFFTLPPFPCDPKHSRNCPSWCFPGAQNSRCHLSHLGCHMSTDDSQTGWGHHEVLGGEWARIGRVRQEPYRTQRGRTGDCSWNPSGSQQVQREPGVLTPRGHTFFQDFRTERVRSERVCWPRLLGVQSCLWLNALGGSSGADFFGGAGPDGTASVFHPARTGGIHTGQSRTPPAHGEVAA